MPITPTEALASTAYSFGVTPSVGLTIGGSHKTLLVTVAFAGGGSSPWGASVPTLGGVSMTLAKAQTGGGMDVGVLLYELLDISGRANDTLALPSVGVNGIVAQATLLDDEVSRIDDGGASGAGNVIDTLTPSGIPCYAHIVGGAAATGIVSNTNIAPYGSQTQLSEATYGPGGTSSIVGNTSWLTISSPTSVGVNISGTSTDGNMACACYEPVEAVVVMDSMPGALVGIPSGFSVDQGDPVITAHPFGIAAAKVGIPSGFAVLAQGPAQFLLNVPGHDRPQMTQPFRSDGSPAEDGDYPAWHPHRPPTLEPPPAGGGAITVAEEDGSPEVEDVTRLEFDGAVVSDEGGGVALVTITPASSLVVAEEDGSPEVDPVSRLEFAGATVSDEGGGVALVTIEGGALTVEEEDGSPSVSPVDTLIFPPGTVTDNADGSVSVREVPTGVIGCLVYNSAVQSIPDNTLTALTFNSEDWDSDGFHSTSANTSRLTVPVGLAGWYWVHGATYLTGSTTAPKQLRLRVNGSTYRQSSIPDTAGTARRILVGAFIYLNAGDYVELVAFQDSAGAMDAGDGSNRNIQNELGMVKLGSGNVSGLDTARARRTSGSVTCNSTSWANVDTGLDLVVPAQAGDVLLVALSATWGAENVYGYLDAATIVGGSPVNYVSLRGGATDDGISGWWGIANEYSAVGATVQYVVQSGDISAGFVTLRLRYRTETAANKTLFATGDNPLMWSVVNLRGGAASRDIGFEFAYAEFTADDNISSTSEASPDNVVSAPAVVFDGNTRICVEFYAPELYIGSNASMIVSLWEGSTDLGRMAVFRDGSAGGDSRVPMLVRRFLTPAAGSRTYHMKAFRSATAAGVDAGAGGTGAKMPGYIRVTKA